MLSMGRELRFLRIPFHDPLKGHPTFHFLKMLFSCKLLFTQSSVNHRPQKLCISFLHRAEPSQLFHAGANLLNQGCPLKWGTSEKRPQQMWCRGFPIYLWNNMAWQLAFRTGDWHPVRSELVPNSVACSIHERTCWKYADLGKEMTDVWSMGKGAFSLVLGIGCSGRANSWERPGQCQSHFCCVAPSPASRVRSHETL